MLGMDIEPEVEEAAQKLYDEGRELEQAGRLDAALEK